MPPMGLQADSRQGASEPLHNFKEICNSQHNMLGYRMQQSRSIMEAVSWVGDDALDDHLWVSELTISWQEAKILEALQYDLANPCVVQWVCCGSRHRQFSIGGF